LNYTKIKISVRRPFVRKSNSDHFGNGTGNSQTFTLKTSLQVNERNGDITSIIALRPGLHGHAALKRRSSALHGRAVIGAN
jgi:hypothetical protein